MAENVCCPLLRLVDCADTDEHKHLFCDQQHTIVGNMFDNDWVRSFCLGDFEGCKYRLKGDG